MLKLYFHFFIVKMIEDSRPEAFHLFFKSLKEKIAEVKKYSWRENFNRRNKKKLNERRKRETTRGGNIAMKRNQNILVCKSHMGQKSC